MSVPVRNRKESQLHIVQVAVALFKEVGFLFSNYSEVATIGLYKGKCCDVSCDILKTAYEIQAAYPRTEELLNLRAEKTHDLIKHINFLKMIIEATSQMLTTDRTKGSAIRVVEYIEELHKTAKTILSKCKKKGVIKEEDGKNKKNEKEVTESNVDKQIKETETSVDDK